MFERTYKFLEHALVEDAFWLAALVVFLHGIMAGCREEISG